MEPNDGEWIDNVDVDPDMVRMGDAMSLAAELTRVENMNDFEAMDESLGIILERQTFEENAWLN